MKKTKLIYRNRQGNTIRKTIGLLIILFFCFTASFSLNTGTAQADQQSGLGCQAEADRPNQCIPQDNNNNNGNGGGAYAGRYLCGNIRTDNNGKSGPLSDDNYSTKFNFGCVGEKGPPGLNPIEDLAFAFLRFLSIGVGVAVVLAVVSSGIQYTMSEGNAEVTGKAKKRIRSSIIGLLIYIFAFSIFQFLVPGGIFWPGDWLNTGILTGLL